MKKINRRLRLLKINISFCLKCSLIPLFGLLLSESVLGQKVNCTIKIALPDLTNDGREMDLTIADSTLTTVVKTGSAEFKIKLTQPAMAVLKLRHVQHGIPYNWFEHKYIYLQPGEVDITVTKPDTLMLARLNGPEPSVDYDQKLLIPVARYNLQNMMLQTLLQNARKAGSTDTAQLNVQLVKNQKECFEVPVNFIRANPGSPLALVALGMLGKGDSTVGVTIKEIEGLFDSLSANIRTSPEGLQFAAQLKNPYDNGISAMTDGPYVFYRDNLILAKYITSQNGMIKTLIDSCPVKDKVKLKLRIAIDEHPEWSFEVTLKANNLPRKAEFDGADKILVLSDIEGEFEPFRNLLLAAKVIDEKYNWIFGKGKLVVAGDLFDRGKQVCQFLWLLYKLEDEARAKGGDVNVILGNHDIMNLSGDFRYVDAVYTVNAKFMNETYTSLYAPDSELGRWLRSKNIMEKIGDLLVTHGGISQVINNLKLPLDSVNIRCRPFYSLANAQDKITDKTLLPFFSGTDALFWYRGYFLEPKATQAQVDSTLAIYACKKIIVGHDIIDHVAKLYGGKVIGVDVDEHQGTHEALLIERDKYYRVDDKGNKTEL